MKTYRLSDEEVNPAVAFDEDEFLLQMPFLDLVGKDRVSIEKIEINFLRKEDIIGQFSELFAFIEDDAKETGQVVESYASEDEEKFVTCSIYLMPQEDKIVLAIDYAVNLGVFEFPLYTAEYHGKHSTGEMVDELIEGSHVFFHDELMELIAKHKGILTYDKT